jgi:hypothetical protein
MSVNTIKQEAFAQAITAGKTKREAAVAAGYSSRCASSLGSQLAKHPRVRARVAELRGQAWPSVHHVAFRPASMLVDDDGNVLGIYVPLENENLPGSAAASGLSWIETNSPITQ